MRDVMDLTDVRALVEHAYIKGFERSGEGYNGEYPGGLDEDTAKAAKRHAQRVVRAARQEQGEDEPHGR